VTLTSFLERLTARATGLSEASAEGARRVIQALAQRRVEAHAGLLEALGSERYLDLIDRLIAAGQSPNLLEGKGDRAAANAATTDRMAGVSSPREEGQIAPRGAL
jgi:hypothetical protein